MYARGIIEKKIATKRIEIAALKSQITATEAFVSGLEEALKALPKDSQAAVTIRPGTNIYRAYEHLKKVGKPLPISELLKAIGQDVTKENRVSLSGSLGSYVRRHAVFTRSGPNTFGLVEFSKNIGGQEPPEDFGALAT
ncbi:MAG: hypothetical protein V1929_12430 [bacterium]